MNSQESLQNRLSSAAAERDAGHAKLELQSSAIEGLKKQIAGLEADFDQYKQVTQYLMINDYVFAHLIAEIVTSKTCKMANLTAKTSADYRDSALLLNDLFS